MTGAKALQCGHKCPCTKAHAVTLLAVLDGTMPNPDPERDPLELLPFYADMLWLGKTEGTLFSFLDFPPYQNRKTVSKATSGYKSPIHWSTKNNSLQGCTKK